MKRFVYCLYNKVIPMRAYNAYAVIATNEAASYANIILKMNVI